MSISEIKRALRVEFRERRHTMTLAEQKEATEGITRNLTKLTRERKAKTIGCYLSSPFEPSTRDYLRWAREQDLNVLVPVSRDDGFLDWTPFSGREIIGIAGTPEIDTTRLGVQAIENADMLIAPAAAVDVHGNRLGWGKGYFDKTLSVVKKWFLLYAVVFDHEIVDTLPCESHDMPIDGAVTPQRLWSFHQEKTTLPNTAPLKTVPPK